MSLHTIDNLLADPLIQAVMQADHVEPGALRGLLTRVATRVAADRRTGARVLFATEPRPALWTLRLSAPSSFAGVDSCLCGC